MSPAPGSFVRGHTRWRPASPRYGTGRGGSLELGTAAFKAAIALTPNGDMPSAGVQHEPLNSHNRGVPEALASHSGTGAITGSRSSGVM